MSVAIMALGALLGGTQGAHAHSSVAGEREIDIRGMAERANLVFVGNVIEVSYRKSQIEGDADVLPYTIVTYEVRKVLRGTSPGRTFSMRFLGGTDGQGRFVEISGVPVFQPGEQDLLFVSGNGEKGCPLVQCEWGRFRILNDGVYNTHGSPVRGLAESRAIARGLPPEEFRKFRYPAPSFEELMKNPEVQRLLKVQNVSLDEAGKRYKSEAPGQIEVRTLFPKTEDGGDGSNESLLKSNVEPPQPQAVLADQAVTASNFASFVKNVVGKVERAPVELKSIDKNAEIVIKVTGARAPITLDLPKAETRPATPEEEAEVNALKAQNFDPVLKR